MPPPSPAGDLSTGLDQTRSYVRFEGGGVVSQVRDQRLLGAFGGDARFRVDPHTIGDVGSFRVEELAGGIDARGRQLVVIVDPRDDASGTVERHSLAGVRSASHLEAEGLQESDVVFAHARPTNPRRRADPQLVRMVDPPPIHTG